MTMNLNGKHPSRNRVPVGTARAAATEKNRRARPNQNVNTIYLDGEMKNWRFHGGLTLFSFSLFAGRRDIMSYY